MKVTKITTGLLKILYNRLQKKNENIEKNEIFSKFKNATMKLRTSLIDLVKSEIIFLTDMGIKALIMYIVNIEQKLSNLQPLELEIRNDLESLSSEFCKIENFFAKKKRAINDIDFQLKIFEALQNSYNNVAINFENNTKTQSTNNKEKQMHEVLSQSASNLSLLCDEAHKKYIHNYDEFKSEKQVSNICVCLSFDNNEIVFSYLNKFKPEFDANIIDSDFGKKLIKIEIQKPLDIQKEDASDLDLITQSEFSHMEYKIIFNMYLNNIRREADNFITMNIEKNIFKCLNEGGDSALISFDNNDDLISKEKAIFNDSIENLRKKFNRSRKIFYEEVVIIELMKILQVQIKKLIRK
ncbi:hypothetical protein COBT_000732 [Conglomerata obtusa]